MQNLEYKIKIFEEWFEKRTKFYQQQRDGKFCDCEIIIQKHVFLTLFNNMYKRFNKHYNDRNECFGDCMMLVWDGINNFQISDNSSWKEIANGWDEKNYCKLISYLKTFVTFELSHRLSPRLTTTRTVQTENGKKQLMIFYNIEPESLNRLMSKKDEVNEMVNFVKESYWNKNEEYKMTIFTQWAKDNLEHVLSKSQIEFLRKLEAANYSKLDNDFYLEELGMNKNAIRQRLKRIYNKMTKEFNKAEKFITGGFVIQTLNSELKVYSKILNIVYGDAELENLNQRVSTQILKSMNNTHFEKLVYEKLDQRDLKTLIKIYNFCAVADDEQFQLFSSEATIPNKTLYRIIELVEQRVEYLERKILEESQKLQIKAKEENVKFDTVQFQIEANKNTYYLRMNPYGIIVPRQ